MKAIVSEVAESRLLRAFGSGLCLYYFLTFSHWQTLSTLDSRAWEEARVLPLHLGQPLAPMLAWISPGLSSALFSGLALLSVVTLFAFQRESTCRKAQAGLWLLFLAKTLFYFLDLRQVANFHHMHLFFSFFFLLCSPRLFWLRLLLAVIYWMAAVVKLSPSWVLGEYFSSLPGGLPLLPHHRLIIALACNLAIVLEVLGPFFFWSNKPKLRQGAVGMFFLFHLYSGFLVGTWYTALMLPLLLFLFADGFRQSLWQSRPSNRQLLPCLAILSLGAGGILPLLIPGDVRHTAEGRYTGLFMYDCNHRTQVQLVVEKEGTRWQFFIGWPWPDADLGQPCSIRIQRNGRWLPLQAQSWEKVTFFHPRYFQGLSARIQNDPYVYYYWAREVERRIQPDRISLRIYSQIDGNLQARKTVDVSDFRRQVTGYRILGNNPWIQR